MSAAGGIAPSPTTAPDDVVADKRRRHSRADRFRPNRRPVPNPALVARERPPFRLWIKEQQMIRDVHRPHLRRRALSTLPTASRLAWRTSGTIVVAVTLIGLLAGIAMADPTGPTPVAGQASKAPASVGGPARVSATVSADAADLCAAVAYNAGFRGSTIVTAVAVALAESGCDPSVPDNINGSTAGCPNGSRDRGLWQINDCYHPEVSDACAYNTQCNARAAYDISSAGTNWTDWTTYNKGLHLQFLDDAGAAVDRLLLPVQRGVDVASWGSGRLDVFAWGSDRRLWHKWYDGGAWSSWQNLGGELTSDPTAVSWGDGRIDVFAKGGSDQLVHKWFTRSDGWSGWQDLGGTLTSAPDVASWGSGRLDVFARGGSNQLVHKWYSNSTWYAWEHLGGTLTSSPSAVSRMSGVIDVFARGGGNQLVQRSYANSSWTDWAHRGGTLTSSPDAASWGSQRVDVFARGGSDELVSLTFSGSWATSWTHLGGTLYSDPGAESWGGGRIDVFARGGNNVLVQRYYTNGSWSGSFVHLGTIP
jgi:hypothetical protein